MHTSGAARPPLRKILGFSLSRIWYPLWALPIILVAVLLPLQRSGTVYLSKDISEPLAPLILSIGLIAGATRWYRHRHAFLLWLTLLVTIFFCRELHFVGTSAMIYPAFLILMGVAWHQYPKLGDYLGSRLFMSLFSTAILCYVIAVGLDNHWWKFLPGDKYQWANVEEYVELTGHLLLVLMAILVKPVNNPLLEQQGPSSH